MPGDYRPGTGANIIGYMTDKEVDDILDLIDQLFEQAEQMSKTCETAGSGDACRRRGNCRPRKAGGQMAAHHCHLEH